MNAPLSYNSTVIVGNARFSILTDQLIRCEYSNDQIFNDSPTQTVIHRDFQKPEFLTNEEGEFFILETSALKLRFKTSAKKFNAESLSITAKSDSFEWKHGQPASNDLPGTIRTLDNANGLINMMSGKPHDLQGSVISRQGWTVIDDSETLIFNQRGFLEPRTSTGEDLYFFGYGNDYKNCLRDYYQLTGPVPLPPKFALGLWWSKWWPYKDHDLLDIIEEFESHGVPLSICVIDMDWHNVFNPYHKGWTGYSWNPHYFSDPEGFFKKIKAKGVHSCLNLHPHEGVAPHEKAYTKMALRLGYDPDKKEIIPFDLSNEEFLKAYFEELHHPLEEQGVDFWWIDWQQGESCSIPGLDPLWYLNHLHSTDISRQGAKRPLIFSRWGDHASHRYPVGFSGDTYTTWETLSILPYFTAASANLGYGWRSDETGGFQRGNHNDHELFTRWNQFACFSPTYRLHNCGDPTLDYRPWAKPAEYREAILETMRLRQELSPYIYTAAHGNATGGACLCRPMYHDYPSAEEAYLCPQQYLFGPDLIVAPFTSAADKSTSLSRQVVWLPTGTWYDYFSGESYTGGRFQVIYGTISKIPVFVRAGASIPLSRHGKISLRVFPGTGDSFIYDDDGKSLDWQAGEFTLTRIQQHYDGAKLSLTCAHEAGKITYASSYEIEIAGQSGIHACQGAFEFPITTKVAQFTKVDFIRCLQTFQMLGHTTRPLIGKPGIDFDGTKNEPYLVIDNIIKDPRLLLQYLGDFTPAQTRCLLEQLTDSGFHSQALPDQADALYYWSNPNSPQAAAVALSIRLDYSYAENSWEPSNLHAFRRIDNRSAFTSWQATVQYPGLWAFTEHRTNRYQAH
jgi:alpha-glucosidase (family GH31 glycosyl hydrolase)